MGKAGSILALGLMLISRPGFGDSGPFSELAGQYYENTLPAEIICPLSEWVLSADGQLRSLQVGAASLDVAGGYVCEPGPRFATCAKADVVDGVLNVPATSGAAEFQRLTILDDGLIALGEIDGEGNPTLLARCPSDYSPVVPHATHAAFTAPPPPAQIGEGAFDVAAARERAWDTTQLAPLPITGVFGDFVLSQRMEAFTEMMASIPIEKLTDDQLQGNSRDELTPERLRQLARTENCRKQPRIFTEDGFMLVLRIAEAEGDAPPEANIRAAFACHQDAEGMISCRKTRKMNGSFAPDPDGEHRVYALGETETAEPYLCRPGYTPADDGACVALVSCSPKHSSPVLRGTNTPLSDLIGWRP
ncbi:hypothetical protein [Jannaschia aquimarina]|uniref:Uncharacterized protein n=1 Tax=Jannaschia aquimarina TaxID=935700 RepID=A0A0D1EE34_9RHOB|nr:hypothetical protein [Jannaschia aquimarina]KIT15949.1 hypothetical protein jaqu_22170 [Jannaschia aquimarina]SNS98490.1 hypothetical protein SAMN05421775_104128 [Jannaschia aquimarina]